ncbi:hypothetical protein IQ37_18050 [Chryseobacterium piperi]|uniref:Uncharacterized protein YyaB-like PH domain-containing protein n=1 Tax=Chryseobacterium piperi TaxID=558152 RepID=A0A086AHH9_9FLAO|nr:PH domain-containing protein [Chryseobacterium piperi]ASW74677.1 hypothetical protein CJF12_10540 [Chryseobacterium piperi]KFF16143.1 hypothetical protein IQ37_18050 [Chryseobacterium piperi]
MKVYKANKKGFIYIIIIFVLIPVIGCYLSEDDRILNTLILAIPLYLLLWIYFDTGYKIEGNRLFYRSGFLRGSINIDDISQITVGKTMWAGNKPALAKKGLIIQYRYDTIYIAPESNDELIADLLNLNPQIKVNGNY